MIAASRGDLAEARRLIEAAEETNAADLFGNTALMYAARGGHADIVDLLLRNGADAQIKNKQGMDCMEFAELRGHAEVATLLMGAKLLLAIREGEAVRVTQLLDRGADSNHQLMDGWTPLMVAALDDQLEVAKILVNRGADAALQNSRGLTAEMIAERKGHSRIIELLRSERERGSRPVPQAPGVESDILDLADAPPGAAPVDETEIVN